MEILSSQEPVLRYNRLAGAWERQAKEVQERTACNSRVVCLLTWRAGVEGKGQRTVSCEAGLLSLELPLLSQREKDHPSVHLQANSLHNTLLVGETGGKPERMFNMESSEPEAFRRRQRDVPWLLPKRDWPSFTHVSSVPSCSRALEDFQERRY